MTARTKWSYCIGATGRDMAYALVSMYLLLYVQYTMGLSTVQFAVISAGMIVCMIWDAVNDLLMGIIIENTHWKAGKFRPWILLGAIVNAIVIVCLFTIRPSGWGFVVFYLIGYLCWGMTFTMNDISYWGMLPSLSSDAQTRNTLVTLMSIFICIGQFSVAGIVPTVIAGNAIEAYRVVALVVALLFIAFQCLTFFGVTESERQDSEKTLSMKDMAKLFARNDQLVIIGVASLLFNMAYNLLIAFGVNFFYVEYGYSASGTYVFIFTVMFGLGTLFSQASYAALTKKFTRGQMVKVGIVCVILGYLGLLAFGYVLPKNLILLFAIGFFIFFFQGMMNLVIIVMINNTIEYDEYRFNERHEPVISAVRSFSVKLASGLNQGITTSVLIVSGIYAMSQNISNLETQVGLGEISSEEALNQANAFIAQVLPSQALILRMGMTLIPIICLVVVFLLVTRKYKIDEKEYQRIVDELEERKAAK